ncbi:hypothetical protein ACEWY4_008346 [Coilia grayii]|uniref:Dapper homolog 3 n=1 Tax=Coilia grayii TaxID=363190 RepID=A0ABD1KBB1_9TELE
MLALEQQLRELSLEQSLALPLPPPPLPPSVCDEPSEDDEEDSRPSSGFYEQSESLSPPGAPGPPATSWAAAGHHRPKSVDCTLLNGEEAREPSPRSMLPRSHSAPFSPLEDIAEGPGEEEEVDVELGEEEDEEEEEEVEEPWPDAPEPETTEEDIQQALRVEAYILSLLQRRALRPRHTPHYLPARNPASFLARTPHPITVAATAHAAEVPPDAADSQGWAGNTAAAAANEDDGQADAELAQALEQYYLALLYPTSRPPSLSAAAAPVAMPLPLPLPQQQQYGPPPTEPGGYSSCTDPESLQSNPDYGEPYPLVTEQQLLTVNYVPVGHPHPHPHPHPHAHPHTSSPFHSKHKQSRASFSGGGQLLPARSSPCRAKGAAEARSSPRGVGKKTGTTATTTTTTSTSRSRSENSLQGGGGGGGGWGRYYTVQRETARARRQVQDEPPHQRRWCSTADLSQEEEEAGGGGGYGGRPNPHQHPHQHPHLHSYAHPHQQHLRQAWPPPPPPPPYGGQEQGRGDAGGAKTAAAAAPVAVVAASAAASAAAAVGGGGSDSSLSEAYSPGSSSFTSDSDESGGGLVWPQEVPPRLASSPPPALSSVVKIKASHALKKKIMRFRSGSLKVMTTV